jgi:glycosyltransferase involved in cell wall biosynthesis
MFETLVIIPAYNEEHSISKVLSGIQNLSLDADILVINDGSTDRTESIVVGHKCTLISLPYNLGYGNALQTGFKYAVAKGYNYIVQFDGDGQHNPENIPLILDELKKNDVDIVIGSRFLNKSPFKIGFSKGLAITLFRYIIKMTTGVIIADPTSGLQGLTKRAFSFYSRKGNFPSDYPDADILIQMLRYKYRVREVPAGIRARSGGKSMHTSLKPIYYCIKVLISICVVLLRQKFFKESCEING